MSIVDDQTTVRKRDGYDAFARTALWVYTDFLISRLQPLMYEKIQHSLRSLAWDLDADALQIDLVVAMIGTSMATQISSHELQLHAATTVASLSTKHPDFSALAGRILVAAVHKTTPKTFSTWVATYGLESGGLFSAEFVDLVRRIGDSLDGAIVHSRDYLLAYPAMKTLEHTYLMRSEGRVIERPQYMYMRVAVAAHGSDIAMVLETYDALSRHLFTPASPVLFNAGTHARNYASCFLYQLNPHTAMSQLESARDLDALWLADGGIGLSLADVGCKRPRPAPQPGVLSLMRVYDAHAEHTSLCRQKRSSKLTVYLPIWHADVRPFIMCRTSQAQRNRVWHLYPSLWVPDIFMQRLRDRGSWSLFDPATVPLLLSTYGAEFSAAYETYEETIAPLDQMPATELWEVVCRAQQESGTPFILYQDAINGKNNQAQLGMIRSSNLCTEIMQYCSTDETAVCTLASISLPPFVRPDRTFDLELLHATTMLAVRTTNAFVDRNDYPSESSRRSAMATRAIGIGAQGLADVFMACGYAFHSAAARQLNMLIFETIYHAAYSTSCDLAERDGAYPAYPGSPAARGILQHDMWTNCLDSGLYDYHALRARIREHGLRNSMLTAQMPTASTAKLLGNFDAVEPYTSNVITHRVLSGDYTELCPWLVRELCQRELWDENMRVAIMSAHGSVQDIVGMPGSLKEVFRTVWEIDPMVIIGLAADRGPFIDQSQSMSLNVRRPTAELMRDLQVHAWNMGLKTGLYYLRTLAPAYPRSLSLIEHSVTAPDDGDMPEIPSEDRSPLVTEPPEPTCDACSA